MSPAPITIIGGGLSGLTLGLCLKHKGLPAVIFDRAASPRHHNYGIVLRAATYRSLLPMLHMDEATFLERTAVHRHRASADARSGSFRCHRGRLEAILRNGLTIKEGRKLNAVLVNPESKEIRAAFETGDQHPTTCLVGCDGPHSATRQRLSAILKLQVLPYVVFNGKRHVPLSTYAEQLAQYLDGTNSIHLIKEDARLEVSVSNVDESQVSLSYTYSRPARGQGDLLHNPDRPNAAATDIPEEFFAELASLSELPHPFDDIFDAEKVRGDRLLHWLMRIVPPNLAEASRLAALGVVLIGDAAHATPILGGEGANDAIRDSIDLAEHIAARGTSDLRQFVKAKFGTWTKAVEDSTKRIEDMHTAKSSRI